MITGKILKKSCASRPHKFLLFFTSRAGLILLFYCLEFHLTFVHDGLECHHAIVYDCLEYHQTIVKRFLLFCLTKYFGQTFLKAFTYFCHFLPAEAGKTLVSPYLNFIPEPPHKKLNTLHCYKRGWWLLNEVLLVFRYYAAGQQ